jgi:hypothetical protein
MAGCLVSVTSTNRNSVIGSAWIAIDDEKVAWYRGLMEQARVLKQQIPGFRALEVWDDTPVWTNLDPDADFECLDEPPPYYKSFVMQVCALEVSDCELTWIAAMPGDSWEQYETHTIGIDEICSFC